MESIRNIEEYLSISRVSSKLSLLTLNSMIVSRRYNTISILVIFIRLFTVAWMNQMIWDWPSLLMHSPWVWKIERRFQMSISLRINRYVLNLLRASRLSMTWLKTQLIQNKINLCKWLSTIEEHTYLWFNKRPLVNWWDLKREKLKTFLDLKVSVRLIKWACRNRWYKKKQIWRYKENLEKKWEVWILIILNQYRIGRTVYRQNSNTFPNHQNSTSQSKYKILKKNNWMMQAHWFIFWWTESLKILSHTRSLQIWNKIKFLRKT